MNAFTPVLYVRIRLLPNFCHPEIKYPSGGYWIGGWEFDSQVSYHTTIKFRFSEKATKF
jgi:hypothetical protein